MASTFENSDALHFDISLDTVSRVCITCISPHIPGRDGSDSTRNFLSSVNLICELDPRRECQEYRGDTTPRKYHLSQSVSGIHKLPTKTVILAQHSGTILADMKDDDVFFRPPVNLPRKAKRWIHRDEMWTFILERTHCIQNHHCM
jgi:hypothetical protein